MNITLTVIVVAIVVLITALVVITIFGGGMTNVGNIAQAESFCRSQCETSCGTTGNPPLTWHVNNLRNPDGSPTSCWEKLGYEVGCTDDGSCFIY
jgi:hypothetical protein